MQTVFRNPLADPFVLGVNSGASLGVAIVLLTLAPLGIGLTEGLGGGQMALIIAAHIGRSRHAVHRPRAFTTRRYHVRPHHRPDDQLYRRCHRQYPDVFQHG